MPSGDPVPNLNNPSAIAQKGEQIYNAKYRPEYEAVHAGKFVAFNIADASATLGETASQALFRGKEQHPEGLFHLIRVGRPGAFEVGLAYKHVDTSRLHR